MWVLYFMMQALIIVFVVSVGLHNPFNRHRVPHFLPNLTHFSRFTPILLNFSSFSTIYPNFCPFCALGYLIDLQPPVLAIYILQATCNTLVMGLSSRGGGFGTELPLKIGSLAKTFLLSASLNEEIRLTSNKHSDL